MLRPRTLKNASADRMPAKRRMSLLLAVPIAGAALVSVIAAGSLHLIHVEAARASESARVGTMAGTAVGLVGISSLATLFTGLLAFGRVRRDLRLSEERHMRTGDELRDRASRDPLTGLPNRLMLGTLLDTAIQAAAVAQTQLAVFCVDLDRFKKVNDRLGHRVGDQYLIELARRLESAAVAACGTLARVGGDEFIAVIPNLSSDEAANTARRMLEALSEPMLIENCRLQGGGSIGVARFPIDGMDANSLLQNADQAMYEAKHRGRNQFRMFDWRVSRSAGEQAEIQDLLRDAVERGGFSVKYQPQFSLDGRVRCLEALLRFSHPKFGEISPGRFIPIAEESGLIVPIGDWVLREVVRQSLAWQAAGLQPVRIAVNVSPLQFAQENFYDSLRRLLEHSGLRPDLLELEITESTAMSSLEETKRVLSALRTLGVLIAIDDFGTGYSSLSYLHKLPLDTIKIDQSFVRDLHSQTSTLPLVQAITSAAHALGLSVVAEGVETSISMQALADAGCDRMQGYLFARPLAVADVPAMLQQDAEPSLPFQQGQRRLTLSEVASFEEFVAEHAA